MQTHLQQKGNQNRIGALKSPLTTTNYKNLSIQYHYRLKFTKARKAIRSLKELTDCQMTNKTRQ